MTGNSGDEGDLDGADRAVRALAREDWTAAAERYTLGAYGTLAGYERYRRGAFDRERSEAGYGVCHLLRAAACARIAGDDDEARNRGTTGALIAVDQRRRREGVDRAACDELVGHCRVLTGDVDGAREAYDRAAEGYAAADVDDPATATTRPLLKAGTDLVTHLSRPDDVSWEDVHGDGSEALARRVRFVKARLPDLLAARVEAGKLHAPRGSTEYGNDAFRCPACGANDVNYVAETVLCLRCSATTERVDGK